MPLTASTDLPELFAQTYEKEREFPTKYNNNLQSLPAPTPKYLGEFNACKEFSFIFLNI